ncbi:RNA polymerase sigma factor [Sphingobacterium yanglingense]|nr:sigma-70 family RNA polymerase sigma factor [Sphingobacterium yanglingense]
MLFKPLLEKDKFKIAYERDERVFEAYFIANYEVLEAYAVFFLKDTRQSEDVASEVMWRLWQLEHKLCDIISVEQYLLRAVKNRCLNILRTRKMVYVDYQEFDEELIEPLDPEQLAITKERLYDLEFAISNLPEKTREAFSLVKQEDYSYKEAAEIMKVSIKTIDNHIQNAIKRLYASLKEKK